MRLAPSFDDEPEGLVKNKDAKPITFVKKKGRLSLKMGGKKVGGSNMVVDRINEMKSEIEHAEAGSTVTTMKDFGPGSAEFKRFGIKSTFPKWFSKNGFNSKKDFMKVINSKKGVRYERLVNQAITDLSNGHSSAYGDVPASTDFKVKTKQVYDNRGVVFRVINGKVRPMKFGSGGVPF